MKKSSTDKTDISSKSIGIYIFFTLVFVGLFGRIIYIQAVDGAKYKVAAMFQQTNQIDKIIKPNRGRIQDRNGQIIALSNVVYNVILDASQIDYYETERLKSTKADEVNQKEKTVAELSVALGIPQETLMGYLEPREDGTYNKYKIVAKKIPADMKKALVEKDLKGVSFEEDSKRVYSFNSVASYIIGFMGGERGYWGIEEQYDKYLKGVKGRNFVTYENSNTRTTNMIEPTNGDTVVSSIDTNIQQFAEESVADAMRDAVPKNAAIIVMNPNTGEILAMASSPGFDLNNPNNLKLAGIDDTNMTDKEINDALNNLHRNYNISDTYEPGSTFKPIVVAAALEEGIIATNSTFNCTGARQVVKGEKAISCWTTHGVQTVEQALANSCNLAMMQIAQKMGRDVFYEYQTAFGFGQKTGIDLPGEASAVSLLHPLEDINAAELATMSFGQTFNCTPLQLITAFSAVINGGNLMKPYVVSQVVDNEGNVVMQNEPKVERKVISKEISDIVRNYLKSTVDTGTGKKIAIEGYTIGGKTGTAQQGVRKKVLSQNDFVLSFIAFLPVENPEIIAISIIDRSKYGDGGSAAPMLKELLEKITQYMGMEPTESIKNSGATKDITIDDYTNQLLIETTSSLSMLNLNYDIQGTGNIIDYQFPAAGETIKEGTTVILYTKSEAQEQVTVPDLSSKTYEEVIALLNELGIVPVVEGDQEGTLISQEPKAQTNISVGGSVKIKFQK